MISLVVQKVQTFLTENFPETEFVCSAYSDGSVRLEVNLPETPKTNDAFLYLTRMSKNMVVIPLNKKSS